MKSEPSENLPGRPSAIGRRRVLALAGSVLGAGAVLTACGDRSGADGGTTVSPAPSASASPQSVQDRVAAALDAVCREHGTALGLVVLDHGSGNRCEYHPDTTTYEASVAKVPIVLTAMRLAKDEGGSLGDTQKEEAAASIGESDNEATQEVFVGIGDTVREHSNEAEAQQPGTPDPSLAAQRIDNDAAQALNDTYSRLSVTRTRSSGSWGDNQTCAPDQMQIAYALVQGIDWVDGGDLDSLRGWMDPQDESQTWGVGAMKGQTVGGQAVTGVGVKNGWLPDDSQKWSINSMGWIRTGEKAFSVGLVSSGFPDQQSGMDAASEAVRAVFREAFGG